LAKHLFSTHVPIRFEHFRCELNRKKQRSDAVLRCLVLRLGWLRGKCYEAKGICVPQRRKGAAFIRDRDTLVEDGQLVRKHVCDKLSVVEPEHIRLTSRVCRR
jgi:hypothetical protein